MLKQFQNFRSAHQRTYIAILSVLIALLLLFILWFEYNYLPPGKDWVKTFRPATLELLARRSPYNIPTFYMPPWVLIPFIPLAILPEKIGSLIITDVGLLSYIFVIRKLKIRPVAAMAFLLCPATIIGLHAANIDWLIIFGFIMPPPIGLFLVLLKPQVGAAVALYWLVEAWRLGKVRTTIKTFLPISLAYLLSFAIFGPWLLKAGELVDKTGYQGYMDISLWPMSIPIGLVFLVMAIRQRKINFAYMASPFLSPYVGANSYAVVILGLTPYPLETVVATVGLWIALLAGG